MTTEDYDAGVELLTRIIPQHPLLHRLRTQGHTRVNERYVKTLMAENVRSEPKARTRVITGDRPQPITEEAKQLQRRKSNLYAERAKLSNRFHDYPDDQEGRANISRDIRHVQNKIKAHEATIKYYARHGKLPEAPPPPSEPKYEVHELFRRRGALNSKMSRLRSNLKQRATARPEKVAEWEQQLKQCERDREVVNGQIGQQTL